MLRAWPGLYPPRVVPAAWDNTAHCDLSAAQARTCRDPAKFTVRATPSLGAQRPAWRIEAYRGAEYRQVLIEFGATLAQGSRPGRDVPPPARVRQVPVGLANAWDRSPPTSVLGTSSRGALVGPAFGRSGERPTLWCTKSKIRLVLAYTASSPRRERATQQRRPLLKTPAPPPDVSTLLAELAKDPVKLVRVFGTNIKVGDSQYLPWDKLRYKQPPEGLTHEEWWLGVRMARDSMQRPLPLYDVKGHAFSYAISDDVLRLVDEISRKASGQIAVSEQVTNPSTRDRYVVSSLIEEAITSSQLEGAATSRPVAKEMIRTGRPPKDRSERMILNNYLAMRRVSAMRDEQFSPELILELHRIVTEGTLDDPASAGRVQSDPDPRERVAIYSDENQVLHIPPPVDQLESRMQQLCDFANSGNDAKPWIPPVLRAVTIHFMAGYDHYFEDGNGRTSRALFYWSMLKQGYWLTEYLTISKILKNAPSQYVRSFMLTEQDGGDLTYFFAYHLRIIQRALRELDDYLSRKVRELRETRVLLSATPGEYNYRQLAILELAIKDSESSFLVQSHAQSHNVSDETARHDLLNLESRGLLLRSKVGKRFVWTPSPKLAETLRAR